jgi:hypothetical protein
LHPTKLTIGRICELKPLKYQVFLETDRPIFPQICVCCCQPSNSTYRPKPPARPTGLPDATQDPFEIPYCTECLNHLKASQDLTTANLVALNIAIWSSAIALMAALPSVALISGPTIAGVYYVWVNKKHAENINCKETCAGKGIVFRSLWYRKSTYLFSFASETYANQFRELNTKSLTPETEIR